MAGKTEERQDFWEKKKKRWGVREKIFKCHKSKGRISIHILQLNYTVITLIAQSLQKVM